MGRIQTAFRLDAALLMRMKRRARAEKKSLNKIVEDLLYKEFPADLVWPKIKMTERPDPFLDSLRGRTLSYTQEEIESDERLTALLEKL